MAADQWYFVYGAGIIVISEVTIGWSIAVVPSYQFFIFSSNALSGFPQRLS
jgi:hypothetical protein